jgi:hypothetical protein
MKKFQIVVDGGEYIVTDTTDKKKIVNEWIDNFNNTGVPGQTLKIYRADGNAYVLVHEQSKKIETNRLIGFGRW